MSAFLAEARSLWKRRAHDAATERAARVFLSEGREVFAPADQALFDAMLARLDPPAGFESWDAWFAYDAAHPMPEDTRSDDEIIDELQRKAGRIPLHDAADAGDLVLVEKLLADGADVNAVWDRGSLQWTPLCAAVSENHAEVARRLLDAGARIAGPGITSAMMSAESIALAELLLERGGTLDDVDGMGRTLLARVIDVCGSVELARFLAARSSSPTPEQAKVYERCARQSTPELKRVVAELLARARA